MRPHTQAYALTLTQRHAEQQAARWLHTPAPIPCKGETTGSRSTREAHHTTAIRQADSTPYDAMRQRHVGRAAHHTLCADNPSGEQYTAP